METHVINVEVKEICPLDTESPAYMTDTWVTGPSEPGPDHP